MRAAGALSEAPAPWRAATLAYLGLPALIFLAGFIRPALALPVALLLLAALAVTLRLRVGDPQPRVYAPAAALAIVLLLLAGFPDGPYAWDWIKHWALMHTLATEPWPVVVELHGVPYTLRFYVGAYLVPALLHRVWPALPLWAAAALWFGAGLVLLLRAAGAAAAGRGVAAATGAMLIVLAMAGGDLLAENLLRAQRGAPLLGLGIHYEHWWFKAFGQQLQLTSILGSLLWVPHQAIPSFLVASLLLFDRGPRALAAGVLATGLLALWSPYGLIGMLPLLLVRGLAADRRQAPWPVLLLASLGAAAFASLMAWTLNHELPPATQCIECLPLRLQQWFDYLGFWVVELAVFALVLRRRLFVEPLCLASLGLVLVVTLVHGSTADFVMRTALGPLFLLSLRSAQVLLEPGHPLRQRLLLWLALAIPVPTVASEVVYHLNQGQAYRALPDGDPLKERWITEFTRRTDITPAEFFDRCGWSYRAQYFTVQPPPTLRRRVTSAESAPTSP